MIIQDLSILADQLRKEGFDARNLGQVGISIWDGREGFFLSAEELRHLPPEVAPRDFRQMLQKWNRP